ncbi:hypothetical protein BKH42_00630 [Helicobacter sp. 13S00482-2]|uniref:hypothetical protein n=1 Tax=Helicobacter sp. 13S00482-2 TaxID=1476200 RepID=UPI000BA4F1D8|nr:hypothetical protein [Helicobacter sp. 13S00482-2]PAF54452.1 hypothetical protein BKH42_00630 [Helicobacter sp. 13S00482-2]
MKKSLLFLSVFSILSANSPQMIPQQIKFPKHIDECIDGYLYRAFVDQKNQIIQASIHQVMEKSSLHEKILPKTCKAQPKDIIK